MLPKRERLSKDGDIKATLKARHYESKSPLLHLIARDNQLANSRLAVVTPGKLGKATVRNRLRRVFVAAYCKICRNFAKNIDIVLFPLRASIGLSVDRIAKELFIAIQRQKIV